MNAHTKVTAPSGTINIRGKEYQTVALRVQRFREDNPDHGLTTAVISRDQDCVVMLATIYAPDGRVLATGHAEEYRKASQINRTSALENAETSAIGRALAALGYGGTEFASANEVQNAIHQQVAGEGSAGTQQGSEVSPAEPTRWTEPDSPLSGIHKLKQELKRLDRELEGCGDSGMVYAVTQTAEWGEFVKIAEKHAPHYLHGGDPAPPEFEGLVVKAKRLVRQFDTSEANHMADVARS